MTDISPRAAGDLAIRREAQDRAEMWAGLAKLARNAVLVIAIAITAGLSGYTLGTAKTAAEAQAQVCAAW